ncbi:MAG: signal peptidase II [Actinomycetota bacterium]
MRPVQDLDVLSPDSGRTPRPLVIALVTAAVVIIVDQLTKAWAVRRLALGPCTEEADNCIDLFWTLRFKFVENPGAAFSTGESLGPLFGAIAAVMTVVLLNLARRRVDRFGPLLLGLIAGGAVGNLIDRIVRAEDGIGTGPVVDFIDFQWWPVFNVADSAVVVGVIALIIYSLFEPDPAAVPAAGAADEDEVAADGLSEADVEPGV